jgi:hypothetical protein
MKGDDWNRASISPLHLTSSCISLCKVVLCPRFFLKPWCRFRKTPLQGKEL